MTTKRNTFSRELMHKSIGSARYVGGGSDPFDLPFESPEYASRIRTFNTDQYFPENKQDNDRTDSIRDERTAAKKRGGSTSVYDKQLANHEWYMHNKRWKQDYNKDYYERNKDYWVKRYVSMKKAVQADMDRSKKAEDEARTNGFTRSNIKMLRNTDSNLDYSTAEFEAAKVNVKRALEEYKWAMDNYKKMSVAEAWSAGAAGIRDAGKKAMNKFAKTSSSALSGFAKSVKGLFSR